MDQRPPWERPDDDEEEEEQRPAEPTEGVRIIGAEEAAEALERGEAAPRRPEGTPRYGDRPQPPEGPRPDLRFPRPADPGETDEAPRPRPSGTAMPHWSEPPTGEVPRILPGDEGDEDDLEAWSSLSAGGPRWRDQPSDWEEDDAGMLHDDETRVGALDETDRPAPDDFFFEEPDPTPPPVRTSTRPVIPSGSSHGGPAGQAMPAADRDVRVAVITGLTFAALALILFSIGPGATLLLVGVVIVLAAAEMFEALRRSGYQPATLLGLVATASLVAGAYWKGETAYPLIIGLAAAFTLLWYLAGVSRAAPTTNAAATMLVIGWVGLLGSFAALLLTHPDGIGVLLGALVPTIAYDVGGLFFGKRFGRAALARHISPNKTVEGLVGGMASAVVAAVLFLYLVPGIHPWDQSWSDTFTLGIVIAVVAPIGDLVESMVKRDLGIKDMSSILPGHGGLLDRFDAILFALPATYYLVRLLEIA